MSGARSGIGICINAMRFKPYFKPSFITRDLDKNTYCMGHLRFSSSCLLHPKPPGVRIIKLYSSTKSPESSLPDIMNFPVVIWPSILKSLKNAIIIRFIIQRYLDKDFIMQDFIAGTKHAVQVVSSCLSTGDLSSLEGLVSANAIKEVSENLYKFSSKQGIDLAVSKEDIYFCFPYEVGIILSDENGEKGAQRREVEITMCYHVYTGFRDVIESSAQPFNFMISPDYFKKIYVLNYRFHRDYTEGVDGQWIVNGFNHSKPADVID